MQYFLYLGLNLQSFSGFSICSTQSYLFFSFLAFFGLFSIHPFKLTLFIPLLLDIVVSLILEHALELIVSFQIMQPDTLQHLPFHLCVFLKWILIIYLFWAPWDNILLFYTVNIHLQLLTYFTTSVTLTQFQKLTTSWLPKHTKMFYLWCVLIPRVIPSGSNPNHRRFTRLTLFGSTGFQFSSPSTQKSSQRFSLVRYLFWTNKCPESRSNFENQALLSGFLGSPTQILVL